MNKFNLTFKGGILPGHEPEQVKVAFGKLFLIDEPERINKFFTGNQVILRRNLERKAAASLYAQLHSVGADVALEKVLPDSEPAQPIKRADPAKSEVAIEREPTTALRNRGMDHEIRESHPGLVDQSWPVNSARARNPQDSVSTIKSAEKAKAELETERREILAREAQKKADEEQAEEEARVQAQREAAKQKAEEAARVQAEREAAQKKAEEAARIEAEREAAQKKAEEAARLQAEREAAQKKAEEAARVQAEREAAQKKAEEAARVQAQREAAKQKAEEAARLEAEREAAQKKAEEAARVQAEREAAQKKAEEAARLQAEREAAQKKAEEAARVQAEREAAQKKAEEAARVQAEREAAQKKAEEAARLQAEREAAQKKAEEAARIEAEREAAQKKAEEAARLQAEREAAQKKAEEAARVQAEREAAKKKAEEAARVQAEREAAQKKAEEKARIQAEREAAQKKAEEKARIQAEREAAKKKAEEEARIQAERAQAEEKVRQLEQKRVAAEAAKKERALREEAKKKAAEEARRLRAKKIDQRRQEAQEIARAKALEKQKKEEERLRQKALIAQEAEKQLSLKLEAKRNAAQKDARLKKARAEQKLRDAELAAQHKEGLIRKHAQDFERLRALKAAEKTQREALERAAREKVAQETLELEALQAEQRRLEAEEAARIATARMDQLMSPDTPFTVSAEEAVPVTVKNLPPERGQKLVPQSIGRSETPGTTTKTSLKVPMPHRSGTASASATIRPRRQPGSPNFFKLRGFRITKQIEQRAERSRGIKQVAFAAAAVSLVALFALLARYVTLPTPAIATGATSMATNQHAELLLSIDNHLFLHDRAGVPSRKIEARQLNLASIYAPMSFSGDDELMLLGQTSFDVDQPKPLSLLRCQLVKLNCQQFGPTGTDTKVSAMLADERSEALYLADSTADTVLKISREGELLAQARIALPANPTMFLHAGLLYINGADAATIGVYRPDDQAFGQQLDEIVLLPPTAVASGQSRVADFSWSSDSWWVTLFNPDTLAHGVYRFDKQWNFVSLAELESGSEPTQLLAWADKVLVLDSKTGPIARFNASGAAEVALRSDTLLEYLEGEKRGEQLSQTLWYVILGFLTIAAIICLGLGCLHSLRNLVYRPGVERNADPIEGLEHSITWLPPAADRDLQYKKLAVAYAAGALLLMLTAGLSALPTAQLLALAFALAGPGAAFAMLFVNPTGHIGFVSDRLLLVDHNGVYHWGRGPRILYRKHFLIIDDIVVFTGTRLIHAFDQKSLIEPISSAGIKTDRKTILVKLLQSGHPLAKGTGLCLIFFVLAAISLAV